MDGPGPETNQQLTFVLEAKDLILSAHLRLGFEALRDAQRFSVENLGYDNTSTESFSRYGLGLMIEIGEFINETPWKRWSKKAPNPERVKEEHADMLAFLGSMLVIMDLWGLSVSDLVEAYMKKLMENRVRFSKENIHPEAT